MCDKGCWKLSGSSAQAMPPEAFIASCRTYTPTPPFPYSSSLEFADRKSGGQFNRRAEAVVAPQQICLSEESIYSHILCLSFKLSFRTIPFPYPSQGGMGALPHPNGGTEKSASPARAADNHSVRRRMLPNFFFSWGYGGFAPMIKNSP